MLPKRGLWVLAQDDGEPMNYERLLEGINALYELASVDVPVSESGVTMPWHLKARRARSGDNAWRYLEGRF